MAVEVRHPSVNDFVFQKVAEQLKNEVSNITLDHLVPNPDLIFAQWMDEIVGVPTIIDPLHKCISANKFTVSEVINWIKR